MGVRSEQGGYFTVKIKPERPFFAGCFGVKIHNNNFSAVSPCFLYQLIRRYKRIGCGNAFKVDSAQKIYNRNRGIAEVRKAIPLARSLPLQIRGTQHAVVFIKQAERRFPSH